MMILHKWVSLTMLVGANAYEESMGNEGSISDLTFYKQSEGKVSCRRATCFWIVGTAV